MVGKRVIYGEFDLLAHSLLLITFHHRRAQHGQVNIKGLAALKKVINKVLPRVR